MRLAWRFWACVASSAPALVPGLGLLCAAPGQHAPTCGPSLHVRACVRAQVAYAQGRLTETQHALLVARAADADAK